MNINDIRHSSKSVAAGAAIGVYGRRGEFFEGYIDSVMNSFGHGGNSAPDSGVSGIDTDKAAETENLTDGMPDKEAENEASGTAAEVSEKAGTAEREGVFDTKSNDTQNSELESMDTEKAPEESSAKDSESRLVNASAVSFKDIVTDEHRRIYEEYVQNREEMKVHDTFKKIMEQFKTEMSELEKAGVFTPEEVNEIYNRKCAEENADKESTANTENTDEPAENIEQENTAEEEQPDEPRPPQETSAKETEENIAVGNAKEEESSLNTVPDEQGQANQKTAEAGICKDKRDKAEYGIDYMFEHNEKLYPFEDSPYDWVRVCMDEIWLLPVDRHEILNPFVMLSDLKYSHLMLGRSLDKKSIVLAVPEKFRREDVKSAYSFGFKDFWRCQEQQGRGVFGYWIKNLM